MTSPLDRQSLLRDALGIHYGADYEIPPDREAAIVHRYSQLAESNFGLCNQINSLPTKEQTMSKLRALLSDLIGDEIQTRELRYSGKSKTVYFKQIAGDGVPVSGGSDDAERGRLFIKRLVAASLCDEAGEPVTTEEELDALPAAIRAQLWRHAAEVNGIDVNEGSSPKA